MSIVRLSIAGMIIILLLAGCSANRPLTNQNSTGPRVVKIKDITIIGYPHTCPMQEMDYPSVWEKFFPIYEQSEHKENVIYYGTMFWKPDVPMDPNSPVTYMVGVPEDVMPSGVVASLEKHLIKGGQYAVFTHTGSLDMLPSTYHYAYGKWIPENGYEERFGDVVEYYDHRFKDQDPTSQIELWIPVQKKK